VRGVQRPPSASAPTPTGQRTEIVADATARARCCARGRRKSAEIYATALQKNAEFYSFWRSLGAYRSVFENGGDLMVLDPNRILPLPHRSSGGNADAR